MSDEGACGFFSKVLAEISLVERLIMRDVFSGVECEVLFLAFIYPLDVYLLLISDVRVML